MWSNDKTCITARVTVLGCSGVGKTALVVRYLTKRYIGDYISGTAITYKCELNFMRRQVEVQIVDTSNEASKDYIMDVAKGCRTENDVLMLVYAVDDVSSFHFVEDILPQISQSAPRASLVVVGNKSDLEHSSTFFETEMRKLSKRYSFSHVTVSAKCSCADATRIFSKSISLVMKKRILETSASSNDLTIHEETHDLSFPPGSRRRRSGGPGTKYPRRATVDCGMTDTKNERRPSDRIPSVDDTIQEEIEEKDNVTRVSLQTNSISHPQPRSFSYRKRKKIPPSSIFLVPTKHSDENPVFESDHFAAPQSAPLPSNRFPVFRFPDVSCAAEYRQASLPTSPDSVLKRNNSFLNKIKGALTAVPQRLRSPK